MTLANTGDAIDCVSPATATVTRFTSVGSYSAVTGRWIDTTTTTLSIKMSIQPVTGRELDILPENDRTREVLRIFTKTQLFGLSASNGQKPDRFAYLGRNYEVHNVEDWSAVAGFYDCLAVKMDDA